MKPMLLSPNRATVETPEEMMRNKTCPFCGYKSLEIATDKLRNDITLYLVRCTGCGSQGPCAKTELHAKRRWSHGTKAVR